MIHSFVHSFTCLDTLYAYNNFLVFKVVPLGFA
uniref:Uncharacterized protein n=1 Tax=Anguilla anguilla TaxID=7936 RepID=A0A0E9SY70_ANGAN